MKMNKKKIPTIVGISLALGLISALTLLRNGFIFFSQAGKAVSPQKVKITNITGESFVVSWITDEVSTGFIELVDSNDKVFFDVRDQPGNLNEYDTHYVEVGNLKPDTEYKFVLNSNSKVFYEEGQRPYLIKTGNMIAGQIPKANLASGKVITSGGEPAEGAVVYVEIPEISSLSALVTRKGNWVIPLARAYKESLAGRANYQEGKIIEKIIADGGKLGQAQAEVFTENDDPVPVIQLGGNYDFTDQDEGLVVDNSSLGPETSSKIDTGDVGFKEDKNFRIINPNDGETINIRRPEIFGEGPKSGKVEIKLESPVTYEAEVEIGSDGSWQWAPPQDLAPGPHTLEVNFTDPQTGEEKTYVRTFILSPNGDDSGPAYSATPSGSTATPTQQPTDAPSTPTNAPTKTPEPTSTAVPTTTQVPTSPPRKTQPSTESGVPDSGFWQPTFILLGGSAILFLSLIWL